jgi:hypothetical protein
MTDASRNQFSAMNFTKKRKENKREDGGGGEQRWEEKARQGKKIRTEGKGNTTYVCVGIKRQNITRNTMDCRARCSRGTPLDLNSRSIRFESCPGLRLSCLGFLVRASDIPVKC